MPPPPRTQVPAARADAWRSRLALALALLLVAWVQRHALMAFFSSPDDLVHLQQARGLRPILASPFRFLSQVLYFRVMLAAVGLKPWLFHAASLAVHLANVVLVHRYARTLGATRPVATLGAGLFGTFRLFHPLLASAVGMNDELALLFALLALEWVARPGRTALWIAAVLFVVGVLCKESILALPMVAVAATPSAPARWTRSLPLLALGGVFAVLKLMWPEQGLAPYALGGIGDAFTNLMTYTSWAVDVSRPLPDLVSSQNPLALRIGLPVCAMLLIGVWRARSHRRLLLCALTWWLAGLLPVLPLRYQTYRHYLYPAVPGLALACAALLDAALAAWPRTGNVTARSGLGLGLATLLLSGYALQSNALTIARLAARIPGTDIPLDPVERRQSTAREALFSLANALPFDTRSWVVVLEPSGAAQVFGARSGRRYTTAPVGATRYDLLRESLDQGGAVRLYFPEVDSVSFTPEWSPRFARAELFLPDPAGGLRGFGRGDSAAVRAGRWMLEQGWTVDGQRLLEAVEASRDKPDSIP